MSRITENEARALWRTLLASCFLPERYSAIQLCRRMGICLGRYVATDPRWVFEESWSLTKGAYQSGQDRRDCRQTFGS